MNKKIAVLMGGNSSEREVSLASGSAILASLQRSNVECFGFDWYHNNIDNLDELWNKTFDKVFIALHGKGGEDGYIQTILEQKNIPYTGTNAINSKNCLNKHTTKQLCKDNNLPTSKWITLTQNTTITSEIFEKITFPVAVKPTNEGSSIGISKANNTQELHAAITKAFTYGDEIIIEQWITGTEYSVAIVQGEVFPGVEIIAESDFYDYEAKYHSDTTQYQIPARLNPTLTKQIQHLALQTFQIMHMKDWGRIDFIKDAVDNFYILEVNTIPGMTSHSLVPMTAKSQGISFDELVLKIIS
jgi:D-alanine-D-alanine ligase